MEVEPTGLEVLSPEECLQHLATHPTRVGRIAFVADGWPVVLPVSYALHRGDVVFRTSLGTKLDTVHRQAPVGFEVDDVDPATSAGWSVLIQGRASEVADLGELSALQALPLRQWVPGVRNRWVRIEAVRTTGRRLRG
jgi:uncharacterized protein